MKGQKPVIPGPKMNVTDALPDGSGTLGSDVQDVIGKQLRAMYDDLVNQAVPDRFKELLQKLDKPENEGKS
jgi:Anti-sigma factor NepR